MEPTRNRTTDPGIPAPFNGGATPRRADRSRRVSSDFDKKQFQVTVATIPLLSYQKNEY